MDVMELLKDYETMRRTGGIFLRDDTRKQITHKIMQGRGAQVAPPEFHIQDKIIRFTDQYNVVRVCTVFHPSYFVPTLM